MSQYFPKPYEPFGGDINVKVDLSNYATKADIKNISHVDTSSFELKTNLANLKSEVDKLDIDKLKPVPTDLSKLSNFVKNDVVKKDLYDKLVTKVNVILKTKYDTDKSKLENKIPHVRGFATKTQLYAVENKIPRASDLVTKNDLITIENKIPSISNISSKPDLTAVENKVPDISNLATKTALTTVENKIPSVSNLATKTALTAVENKIPDISNLATKTTLTTVKNKIPSVSNLATKTA